MAIRAGDTGRWSWSGIADETEAKDRETFSSFGLLCLHATQCLEVVDALSDLLHHSLVRQRADDGLKLNRRARKQFSLVRLTILRALANLFLNN